MEGDRKSYTEESQNVIRKQRGTIDKLKTDNEKLKEELAFESRYAHANNKDPTAGQVGKLQDQADTLQQQIDQERSSIDEYSKEIKSLQSKILEQRQLMGGVNSTKENNQLINKQIRILENRLDKSLVKFNEALAHNRKLREQIDNLRRERVVFDGIYKKMERELHERKKEMANIIEVSNVAYEARDQAQAEIAQLRAQSEKERIAFETEWKELGKSIEKDRRMQDFMKIKDRERASNDPEDDKRKSKTAPRGRAEQQVAMEKVQSYEEAFAKIQQATGISDIDELVTTFINAEDQNFSLFNFVNELNNEIEKLEEQIAEIRAEIEKYRGQGVNTDNQRKKILKDLEDRLGKTLVKSELFETKYQAALKMINALKTGIQSVFTRIGCNTAAVSDMLGNAGVTEASMMTYLGIIEQRTNEILQLYSNTLANRQDKETNVLNVNAAAMLGQGPQTPAGTTQIQIHPPSTGEDLDSEEEVDEDEEERPLTRDELKAKTVRGLSKRDGAKRGAKKPPLRQRARKDV